MAGQPNNEWPPEVSYRVEAAPPMPCGLEMRLKLLFIVPLFLFLIAPNALSAQRDAKEDVSIKGRAFQPATLRIKKGESVTWKNNDDIDHTVDAEDGSFSSGTIKSGKSFTHTFKKAGKYAYSCHLHPRMKGTIVVE
jgi:plastocyanin